MSGVIRRRFGARRDLVTIYRHFARGTNIRIADRFLSSAEATFRRLADHPGLGTSSPAEDPSFRELRFFPLPSRFKNYLVFYRPTTDGVEIARVLHGARDIPGVFANEFDDDLVEDDQDDEAP